MNDVAPPRTGVASTVHAAAEGIRHLGDFTTSPRVLVITAIAIVVGTGGVIAGVLLLNLIRLCTNLAYFGRLTLAVLPLGQSPLGAAAVVVPVIGALIVGLMARYGSDKIRGHGIPEAIEAILLGRSRLDVKVAILKPLSSAIAIGSGGPFGAEGPIIMTGGAIGSLIAQMLPVSDTERKTLLVAGAAAGMTTVFGTPIAGIMLAVELLLFEWTPRSFVPVAAACVVAEIERHWLGLPSPLFPFSGGMNPSLIALLCWVLMGLLSGLLSGVLTQLVYACEDGFLKLPIHWMWWPMLGGVVVGIGGLIEPNALGVGYDNIARMLQGGVLPAAALLLLVVKAIIWSVALGSGTSGGVLAPLLIMGGGMGAALASVLPAASPGFWPLLAMSATMGGTMRSPLTATFFAAEITGNTHVLLPLITACVTAHVVTVLLMRRSILTEKVARRGHHLAREYQVDPFTLTRVGEVMATEVVSLPDTMTLHQAAAFLTESRDDAPELPGGGPRPPRARPRRSAIDPGVASRRQAPPDPARRAGGQLEDAGCVSGRISGGDHRPADAGQCRAHAGDFPHRCQTGRLSRVEGSAAHPRPAGRRGEETGGVLPGAVIGPSTLRAATPNPLVAPCGGGLLTLVVRGRAVC